MIPARDWRDVLAALKFLGCTVVSQSQRHIQICRGAVKMATIPKAPVSGMAQGRLISVLDFSDSEFLTAITQIVQAQKTQGQP